MSDTQTSISSAWKLRTVVYREDDRTLLTGTEAEVKAEANRLFACAYEADSMNEAAALFSDLYVTRPDGTHQGTRTADPDCFERGEMPQWEAVDW